jgi:uncharacterized membrane protein YcgQ (UPF0703/DUF1980 family)
MNTFRRVSLAKISSGFRKRASSSSSAASAAAAAAALAFFACWRYSALQYLLQKSLSDIWNTGKEKKKHTRKVQKSKNLNSTLTLDNYLMIKYNGLVMKNTLENFKSSSNALITFLGTKSKYARCTAGFSAKT